MKKFYLSKLDFQENLACGIRTPGFWNPECSSLNPESRIQVPLTKTGIHAKFQFDLERSDTFQQFRIYKCSVDKQITVLDSLAWGDVSARIEDNSEYFFLITGFNFYKGSSI